MTEAQWILTVLEIVKCLIALWVGCVFWGLAREIKKLGKLLEGR